jgi:hypothetical protein
MALAPAAAAASVQQPQLAIAAAAHGGAPPSTGYFHAESSPQLALTAGSMQSVPVAQSHSAQYMQQEPHVDPSVFAAATAAAFSQSAAAFGNTVATNVMQAMRRRGRPSNIALLQNQNSAAGQNSRFYTHQHH